MSSYGFIRSHWVNHLPVVTPNTRILISTDYLCKSCMHNYKPNIDLLLMKGCIWSSVQLNWYSTYKYTSCITLVNIIYFSSRKNVTHPLNLYMRFTFVRNSRLIYERIFVCSKCMRKQGIQLRFEDIWLVVYVVVSKLLGYRRATCIKKILFSI